MQRKETQKDGKNFENDDELLEEKKDKIKKTEIRKIWKDNVYQLGSEFPRGGHVEKRKNRPEAQFIVPDWGVKMTEA